MNIKIKNYRAKLKKAQMVALGMSIIAAVSITGLFCTTDQGKKICKNIKKKVVKTAKTINDKIEEEKDAVEMYAAKIKKNAKNTIQDIDETADDVKNDIEDGYDEVAEDISETFENISDDFKKPFGHAFRKAKKAADKENI